MRLPYQAKAERQELRARLCRHSKGDARSRLGSRKHTSREPHGEHCRSVLECDWAKKQYLSKTAQTRSQGRRKHTSAS